MNYHELILKFFNQLGYPAEAGLCHGITLRWLEASLINKTNEFVCRVGKIIEIAKSEELLNAFVLHVRQGKNPEKWLDICSFFDSVALFHSPRQFASCFASLKELLQINVEESSRLASSDDILKSGGLKSIYSQSRMDTQNELMVFLDELTQRMERVGLAQNKTISFLLASSEHTIGLTYTIGQGWDFFDINQYPPKFIHSQKTIELVKRIHEAFNDDSSSPYMAFNVFCYDTKSACSLQLKEQLDEMKASRVLTEEIAKRKAKHGVNLAYIALKGHDNETFKKLLPLHSDLSIIENTKQETLAHVAVAMHNEEIVQILLQQQEDLFRKADREGYTPIAGAAYLGYEDIIKCLVEHDPLLLKIKTNDGFSIAHLAALAGHEQVIQLIAEHSPDVLLIKDKKWGWTALHWAVYDHKTNVIETVIKRDKQLLESTSEDGSTLFHVAAINGVVPMVELLVKHVPHLLTAMNHEGLTPAFLAVLNNHMDILRELVKHQVDLNQACYLTVEGCKKWLAGFKDKDTVFRIEALIKKQTEEFGMERVAITLFEVAKVKENSQMIQFLKNQNGSNPSFEWLFKAIHQLKTRAGAISHAEATKAIELAEHLKGLANQYMKSLAESDGRQEVIRAQFKQVLAEGYKNMQHHRAYWKPLLANIAVAATGIGLLFILYRWLSDGHGLFMQTQRQKELHRISEVFLKFERSFDNK